MKKFIIIAMVAVSAVISQAASFNWNVTNTGLGTDGYGYAFTGTAADRAAVALLLAAGDIGAFQAYYAGLDNVYTHEGADFGANSHVALGAGQTLTAPPGGLTAVALGGAKNVFEGSTVQGVFYVLFDNADPLKAEYYNISARIQATLPAGGATSTSFNPAWANWGGTGVSGSTTWMPVPEPTAMALLALGAAAVGLRRRFRK